MNNKTIQLTDLKLTNMKDNINRYGFIPNFKKNKIVIKDGITGEVLKEKENLVVLRGRVFTLEKIFMTYFNGNALYKNHIDKGKICLFQLGSGGANVPAEPFVPKVPSPHDLALANPVPFRVVNTLYPQTAIDPLEQSSYHGATVVGNVTSFYYKTFEQAPEFFYNFEESEVYVKTILKISAEDYRLVNSENNDFVRNTYVNELGIFFASYNTATNTYDNPELFSRICFETEPLMNLSKTLVIEYYVYA